MKHLHLLGLACGGLILANAASGRAQVIGPRPGTIGVAPFQGPTVSPYLNLNRAGSPAAINYYGLVRPQIDFTNSIQQLQQQVTTNRTLIETEPTELQLPTTGHPAGFMTQGTYFNALNRGGTAAPVTAATLPRVTATLPQFNAARGASPPSIQR